MTKNLGKEHTQAVQERIQMLGLSNYFFFKGEVKQ